MIRHLAVVRQCARRCATAANGTLEAYHDQRVEHEPAFTDRMLGRIEQVMEGFEIKGIRWRAKTLTDRGSGSQESRFGADFVATLEVDLPSYSVKKGFLAQAKITGRLDRHRLGEFSRLRRQCEKMVRVSHAAYVFLYSQKEIRVIPALALLSLHDEAGFESLYSRNISRFFEEHFESFLGDPRIHAPSITLIEALADLFDTRSALCLRAELAS